MSGLSRTGRSASRLRYSTAPNNGPQYRFSLHSSIPAEQLDTGVVCEFKFSGRKRICVTRDGEQRSPWRIQKTLPATLAAIEAKLPAGNAVELWWQYEARVGQKNTITRRWAKRGTRPRAPHDQRTKWAYIFGAICPAKGKGAGLVMPWCDTQVMSEHLKEISATVDPGAHAVLLLDQAGWHGSAKLIVPANITLLPLPPAPPN